MGLAEILAIVGLVVIVIGAIAVVIGKLWFLIQCFCESFWWGLGCLFVPFVSLIFLIVHWHAVKKPFALVVIGFCIMMTVMLLMPEALNDF